MQYVWQIGAQIADKMGICSGAKKKIYPYYMGLNLMERVPRMRATATVDGDTEYAADQRYIRFTEDMKGGKIK